jgi:diguanylate cyclase (GGDEF)-like protein/PAS domain S-box-containing protein
VDQTAPIGRRASEAPAAAFAELPDFWAAFAHAATGMMIADFSGHFLYANPAYCAILGYTEAQLKALSVREITHPDDRADTQARGRRLLTGEIPGYVVERRYLHVDGREIWVRNSLSAVRDATGRAVAMLAISEDVTAGKKADEERTHAEAALHASEERLRMAVEATGLGTWEWNPVAERAMWSTRLEELYGLPPGGYDGTLGMFRELIHPEDRARVAVAFHDSYSTGADSEFEYRAVRPRPDGSARWLLSRGQVTLDVDGRVLRGVGTVLDITDRKLAEQALQHQAFHDALTGLPNRALFSDRLEHALARAGRQGNSVAVLFLDLDNFKVVNDSLGHAQGDTLLVAVADRLRACLRAEDTGARLSGDEFTVLLEDVSGEADAIAVAERIARALAVPVMLQGREVVVTASIGVAISMTGGGSQDLLREADLAMYRSKATGKARCSLFNADLETRAMERLELEADLRRALVRGEFRVHYQPIISLADETIAGVEALLRWEHPERGLVQPLAFIPLAEETGLIIQIGQWVLEQACQQSRIWQADYPRARPLTISVNLSARQLQHPELVRDITRAVRDAGLDPGTLELEITESVVMQDAEATDATLRALKAIGIRLAIDDFGTGYSSLSYLKRFPVDTLKIDRSFVDGLGQDSQDTAIVRSVAALARALDLSVTGEGVETHAQHRFLQALGCEQAQGYLYARPLPPAEVSVLLAHGANWGQSRGFVKLREATHS